MAETIATKYMIEASSIFVGEGEPEKKVIPINVSFNPNGYYFDDAEQVINKFIETCSDLSMARGKGWYGIIRAGEHTFIAANDDKDWILLFSIIPIV